MTYEQLKNLILRLKKGDYVLRTFMNGDEENKEIYHQHTKNFIRDNLNMFTLVTKYNNKHNTMLKFEHTNKLGFTKSTETIIIEYNENKNIISVTNDLWIEII